MIATLAYVANWRFYASGQSYAQLFSAPSPVLHFWSLAIEEQFYVVFPLIVAVVDVGDRAHDRTPAPASVGCAARPPASSRRSSRAACSTRATDRRACTTAPTPRGRAARGRTARGDPRRPTSRSGRPASRRVRALAAVGGLRRARGDGLVVGDGRPERGVAVPRRLRRARGARRDRDRGRCASRGRSHARSRGARWPRSASSPTACTCSTGRSTCGSRPSAPGCAAAPLLALRVTLTDHARDRVVRVPRTADPARHAFAADSPAARAQPRVLGADRAPAHRGGDRHRVAVGHHVGARPDRRVRAVERAGEHDADQRAQAGATAQAGDRNRCTGGSPRTVRCASSSWATPWGRRSGAASSCGPTRPDARRSRTTRSYFCSLGRKLPRQLPLGEVVDPAIACARTGISVGRRRSHTFDPDVVIVQYSVWEGEARKLPNGRSRTARRSRRWMLAARRVPGRGRHALGARRARAVARR